jgi:hypothetical protein
MELHVAVFCHFFFSGDTPSPNKNKQNKTKQNKKKTKQNKQKKKKKKKSFLKYCSFANSTDSEFSYKACWERKKINENVY